MTKTIISFDIGIKNLAYCIFVLTPTSTTVLKWNIANLIKQDDDVTSKQTLCSCMKPGKKKTQEMPCAKKGAFKDSDGKVYCLVHAKSSGKIIPSKDMSITTIKKMKLDELKTFCNANLIVFADSDKKPDIIAKVETVIKSRTLVPIKSVKQNANHVHLVEIGKQIRTQLDEVLKTLAVDIVILENQISPIAGRMNTIQGMLAQYFIMRPNISSIPKIEFISSSGKLKDYKGAEKSTSVSTSTYKDHKRDGIAFCRDFMTANAGLRTHQEVLESSTKKDDLADCFLQGIYYMKKEKLITYSEDLEINGVSL